MTIPTHIIEVPLTAQEATELENLLVKQLNLLHAMGFTMFDGYICALIIGPNSSAFEQWLPFVWDANHGMQAPSSTSPDKLQRSRQLMLQHYYSRVTCLTEQPDRFVPAINWTPLLKGSETAFFAWRRGFELAVNHRLSRWQPYVKAQPMTFAQIMGYSKTGNQLDELTASVRSANAWWQFRRRMLARFAETGSPEPLRTAPCPCGSGIRFKHCHGTIA